tara:strand:- start:20 stop:415 length:396 start_codon:yes stop_codon:yes gene_type:complete
MDPSLVFASLDLGVSSLAGGEFAGDCAAPSPSDPAHDVALPNRTAPPWTSPAVTSRISAESLTVARPPARLDPSPSSAGDADLGDRESGDCPALPLGDPGERSCSAIPGVGLRLPGFILVGSIAASPLPSD